MDLVETKPIIRNSEYCRSLDDLQATALSINYNGDRLLLAGRRHLALINLDRLDRLEEEDVKLYHRNSKFEVSCAEFAICQNSSEYCAIATSQLIEVVTWDQSEPLLRVSLRAHTRVVTDIDWHLKVI